VRIGELSRRTGVSHRSLRHYEAVGLLHAERSASGWREYAESAVDQVLLIKRLLSAGLPTSVIRELLPCLSAPAEARTGYLAAELDRQVGLAEDRLRAAQEELDRLRAVRAEESANLGVSDLPREPMR
jgi:DNA-binding transcriptional MerR regulator